MRDQQEKYRDLSHAEAAHSHAPATTLIQSGADQHALNRLRWRCRRGMRELDVVLERYLHEHYAAAPLAEQQAFAHLLELQDPQLFAFVLGRATPEDRELAHVITRLTRA